jgi:hypothetical protein
MTSTRRHAAAIFRGTIAALAILFLLYAMGRLNFRRARTVPCMPRERRPCKSFDRE